jgi:phage gp36-like protein
MKRGLDRVDADLIASERLHIPLEDVLPVLYVHCARLHVEEASVN